jgi:hypothetical protein
MGAESINRVIARAVLWLGSDDVSYVTEQRALTFDPNLKRKPQ